MKRKKSLSGLTTRLQEAPAFAAPQAETLIRHVAASETREPPQKTIRGRSRFPWLLALVLLVLISSAAPLLLFLSIATVAVPLLVLLTVVGLACWKVADWTYRKTNKRLGDPQ
jgi:hypothetical protein